VLQGGYKGSNGYGVRGPGDHGAHLQCCKGVTRVFEGNGSGVGGPGDHGAHLQCCKGVTRVFEGNGSGVDGPGDHGARLLFGLLCSDQTPGKIL
jgi:hypothetical protein